MRARTGNKLALITAAILILLSPSAQAISNLVVTGSAPATETFGASATFSFSVANLGPDLAQNVVLRITAPSGFDVSIGRNDGAGGVDCNFDRVAGRITGWTCSFAGVPPGVTRSAEIGGQLTAVGRQTAIGSATFFGTDPVPNNSALLSIDVTEANADLGAFVSAPPTVLHDASFQYRFTLSNDGPDAVPDFAATLQLPPGVSDPSGFSFGGGFQGCTEPGAAICGRSPSRPFIRCFFPGAGGARSVTCRADETWNDGASNFGLVRVTAETVGDATASLALEPNGNVIDDNPNNDSDDTTTNIEPMADLSLSVDAPGNVQLNQFFDYRVEISNAGPDRALATQLSLELPAGVAPTRQITGASCTGSTSITCQIDRISPASSVVVTVRARATALGNARASGSVASSTADIDSSNNSDDATITVTTVPVTGTELELTGSATPASPYSGEFVSYEFVLNNNGPDTAENVRVTGNYPSELQSRSLSASGGSCSYVGNPRTGFTCDLPDLANGDSWSIRVGVNVNQLGRVDVSATATTSSTDRIPGNNSATISTTVRAANADVAIGVSGPSLASLGDRLSYRFSLSNQGPEPLLSASGSWILPLEVSTPPGFSFPGGFSGCTEPGASVCGQSPTSIRPRTRCFFPGRAGSRSVTCSVSDLAGIGVGAPGGEGGSVTVRVDAASIGTATVDAFTETDATINDSNTSNNTASLVTNIIGAGQTDLELTKSAPETAQQGAEFDYTISVRNQGPITATAVRVVDSLPAGVDFVSASGSGTSCSGASTITCQLGELTPFQSRSLSIRVRATDLGTVTNTASVSAAEADPISANNSASASVLIREPGADLSLSATGPSEVTEGDQFDIDMVVVNDGPDQARNVRVRGTLGPGLERSGFNPDCFSVSNGFECFLGVLNSGRQESLRVRLQASQPGSQQVPIAVTQLGPDPDPSNDSRVYQLDVTALPKFDLAAVLNLPGEVALGDMFQYTLDVTNNGPDAASSVSINSFFPTAPFDSEAVSATAGACSLRRNGAIYSGDSATSVVCGPVALAPGEEWTITVTARAVTAGSFMVLGRVFESARGDDPEAGNNTEEKTLDVVPPFRFCNVDGDPDVDLDDIQAILAARGQPATGPDDPRDPDGDGLITALDARQCVLQCDLARCASP